MPGVAFESSWQATFEGCRRAVEWALQLPIRWWDSFQAERETQPSWVACEGSSRPWPPSAVVAVELFGSASVSAAAAVAVAAAAAVVAAAAGLAEGCAVESAVG